LRQEPRESRGIWRFEARGAADKRSQCLDGGLNKYRDKCLDMIGSLKDFNIEHVQQGNNVRANVLAHQASGYDVQCRRFGITRRPATDLMLAIQGEEVVGSDVMGNDD
jgi:hypothetical protein